MVEDDRSGGREREKGPYRVTQNIVCVFSVDQRRCSANEACCTMAASALSLHRVSVCLHESEMTGAFLRPLLSHGSNMLGGLHPLTISKDYTRITLATNFSNVSVCMVKASC